VTEYYPKGSLASPRPLTPTDRSTIAYGVACSLRYLHDHSTIHGDLKPSNVLLGPALEPKVVVYGFKRGRATSPYCAPEVFSRSSDIDHTTDIYGFGMLLCFLWVGELPFDDSLSTEELGNWIVEGERPILPGSVPQHVSDLIQSCWNGDRTKRSPLNYLLGRLVDPAFHFPGTDLSSFERYRQSLSDVDPVRPVAAGDPTKKFRFAMMLKQRASSDKRQMKFAAQYLKSAADDGVFEAAFEYAQFALNGTGIARDLAEAEQYLRIAADHDNVEAMWQLSQTTGSDCDARRYLRMASDKGHPQAVYQLALRSKQASPTEVAKSLKIAADGGVAESAYRYAFMVQKGE
jgi:hypothetical protein